VTGAVERLLCFADVADSRPADTARGESLGATS